MESGEKTNLCFDESVLRTSDEDETLDFEEVGQFCWVEFPDADCVAFFVFACEQGAKVFDDGEIGY
jgi:hypothetical protein